MRASQPRIALNIIYIMRNAVSGGRSLRVLRMAMAGLMTATTETPQIPQLSARISPQGRPRLLEHLKVSSPTRQIVSNDATGNVVLHAAAGDLASGPPGTLREGCLA